MNHFLLPQLYKLSCCENINIEYNGEKQETINISLHQYLNAIKTRIDVLESSGEWNNYKKYTNPYEFIHSVIPDIKKTVCTIRPISRSYYKLIEIINTLELNDVNNPIETFHLAEGPGGFIEAICYLRSNIKDKYYGMTLIDNMNINQKCFR